MSILTLCQLIFLMIIIINISSLFSRNIRYFVRICILAYCILHFSDIINGFMNINETEFLVRQSQGSTIGYNCISLLDFLRKACNVSHIFLILLLHI